MIEGLKTYGSEDLLLKLKGKKPLFICTIATTDTADIPDVSGAGASTDLIKYTPASDVEIILRGKHLSCNIAPQTVVGGVSAPTPAIITKAQLELTNVPFLVVDAGSKIKPKVPYIKFSDDYGRDIRTGEAVINSEELFNYGKLLSKELSKTSDYLIIGESIPGGTTTSLGVLTALGYDANFKVSGSKPINPHNLKKDLVLEGIANYSKKTGKKLEEFNSFDAVISVGDPMIAAVCGMIFGSEKPVILAGGTQMAGVLALTKAINKDFDFKNLAIATTSFVAEDESADLLDIISQISKDIAVNVVNPSFEKSSNQGLINYTKGYVKEGVGAGGAMFMSLLLGHSIEEIFLKIEEVLERN